MSSQFITGLLYALPLLDGDSEILLTTSLESRGYVNMTLDALAKFGIRVEPAEQGWHIPGGQTYCPQKATVESDYSQAAFYYAARLLGSPVQIQGLNSDSAQGDAVILEFYHALNCPGEVELDVSQCPDLVPPLAAMAALRPGQMTRIVEMCIRDRFLSHIVIKSLPAYPPAPVVFAHGAGQIHPGVAPQPQHILEGSHGQITHAAPGPGDDAPAIALVVPQPQIVDGITALVF